MASVSAVLRRDKAEISRLAGLAESFGQAQRLSDDDVMAINLVLDEVITNVIDYGFEGVDGEPEIRLTLTLEGDELTIQVEDNGRAFDPLQAAPPDLEAPLEDRPVGGLGIHLVRSVMNTVEYDRRGGRNVLTMHKTISRT
jgi:anti-sigma regulatory factor (Ser/Thr protein kinase)